METRCRPPSSSWRTGFRSTESNFPTAPPTGGRRRADWSPRSSRSCTSAAAPGSGWHGAADEELEPFEDDGLELVPVPLSSVEVAEYYEGFSNATLWPLYHDAIATPQFRREWWETYVTVNQRFADRTAQAAAEGAVVWVQDYQLQLVPQMLRRLRPDLRIGFFLHIPFPPTELFVQLPWRAADPGRAPGRGSGRLSTARRRPELCPAGAATAWSGDHAGSHPDA